MIFVYILVCDLEYDQPALHEHKGVKTDRDTYCKSCSKKVRCRQNHDRTTLRGGCVERGNDLYINATHNFINTHMRTVLAQSLFTQYTHRFHCGSQRGVLYSFAFRCTGPADKPCRRRWPKPLPFLFLAFSANDPRLDIEPVIATSPALGPALSIWLSAELRRSIRCAASCSSFFCKPSLGRRIALSRA